jgi:hypothetical protein
MQLPSGLLVPKDIQPSVCRPNIIIFFYFAS